MPVDTIIYTIDAFYMLTIADNVLTLNLQDACQPQTLAEANQQALVDLTARVLPAV